MLLFKLSERFMGVSLRTQMRNYDISVNLILARYRMEVGSIQRNCTIRTEIPELHNHYSSKLERFL